ncbi:MAG: acyltransferase family protein [Clostridia bacterium]|nr:acyltransferase family protein [Clostridia bacterium]
MAETNKGLGLEKPRLIHLDLLRLIAIYLVIFNHTGNFGYTLFGSRVDSPFYFVYMATSVFCKIAVPLFFMISGALLLSKEETYKQLFLKRILRITVVLLLISVPYYLWLKRSYGISVLSFFTYIYGNSASTSLWYLYSYIGFLLMLPFLRKTVKSMQHKDFLYLFIGYIIMVGVLPSLEYCLSNGNVTIHGDFRPVLFMSQSVFFGLMGYYLEYVFDPERIKIKIGLTGIVLSLIVISVTCVMTHFKAVVNGAEGAENLELFFNNFIAVPTVTVYYLVKCFARRIVNLRIQSGVVLMGSAVFGVYLIEKFIRAFTSVVYTLCLPVVGSFIASLIWCLVVWSIGLIVVMTVKHIPVIKKLVNKFI